MRKIISATFVALASCGGGDDDRAPSDYAPPFLVTGTALYEKRLVDPVTATLTTNVLLTGIPSATVEIVDSASGSIVSRGGTDPSGGFALQVPGASLNSLLFVRVLSKSSVPYADVTVGRWPQGDHSVESSPFTGAKADSLVTAMASDATGRVAGAFNILAQTIRGIEFVRSVEPTASFPPLRIFWSKGDSAIGPSCTCQTHAHMAGHTEHQIFIQDFPDDTNDFDDSVILHEFAHFVQNVFSHDSHPGGEHHVFWPTPRPQNLDYRLSFSEGWASAFGQMVQGHPFYIDTRVNGGGIADLERPVTDIAGPGGELAIAAMFWDLFDGAGGVASTDSDTLALGFGPIFSAMRTLQPLHHVSAADFRAALLGSAAVSPPRWDTQFAAWGLAGTMPPFPPNFINLNTLYRHDVDASLGQSSLFEASRFYRLDIPRSGTLTVTLTITDPARNDLDVMIWERPDHPTGEMLALSDSTSNAVEALSANMA